MFSKRIISMLVVLSFISQALVVVDTDSYSSAVVEDSSILEELYGENGARSRTVENATLLKDVVSGSGSSNPQSLFAHTDGNLYFSAGGYSCWRSDGTEEGTVPFSGGHCTYFASLGDTLLFAKEHDTYGWELHSYDGSSEPVIVKNINEDDSGSGDGISDQLRNNPAVWPISVNDEFVLFGAQNESDNVELWRSDGTEDGTYMVKEIDEYGSSRPAYFFPLDEDRVLFSAQPAGGGFELWISDGTEAGTNAVGTAYSDGNSFVSHFTRHNDIVYFVGSVGGTGSDKKALWRTDGTADGTYRLTNASNDSSCTVNCIDVQSPGIPLGDILIFEGHSIEYGEEFYKYNPATNETSLVVDMEPGSDDSQISTKFIVGTDLFFTKYNDTTYETKMYKTDGTAEGTSEFFSTSEGASLIRVPPTQGQFHFESYLPNFEDIGLFIAPRESGGGREVWVTDGTIDGTYQLTDIYPDGKALPDDGHIAGGHLFFSAIDSEHGEELRIIRNFTDFTPYKPSYTLYTNDEMDPITFNYDESLFQGSIENPTWTTANLVTTGYGENFHVADIDGDGDLDYVSGRNNDNIAWHENDGNVETSWTTHLIPHNLETGGSNGANHVHSADVDDDGDMDIIASFHYIDTVVWFENDGSADPTWT
ncbi:MAG: FG-GAP-like repeat-containing protein, partial [Candidatus Thermoplasmatota archaeon]|nr:FG-GAP-like repeat-containing protein [Candidatus Thermoplasmatota archaeon]